jgi:hypothetical protein
MEKSWLAMTEEIFNNHKKPMHVSDIAEVAKTTYALSDDIEKIKTAIGSALTANIKRYKNKSIFSTVPGKKKGTNKKGWYRLKNKSKVINDPPVIGYNFNKNYFGKAGEYGVLSELLFQEFNASIMTVDEGLDVVASKANKYFYIQVKTSSNNQFSISMRNFQKYDNNQVFYVFVLRIAHNSHWISEYLVLPCAIINQFVTRGVVGTNLSFSIKMQRGKYTLNAKEDVSWHINNFDSIR